MCLALPLRQGGDPTASGWGEAEINHNILARRHIPRFFPSTSLSPSPVPVAGPQKEQTTWFGGKLGVFG